MTVWMLVGVSAAAAMLALLLRRTRPEQATAVALIAGAVIAAAAFAVGAPAISRVASMLQGVSVGGEYGTVLLKALGICLLTQTASDVCRDAGETALAGKTELAGKVLLLLCGLPLYEYAAKLLGSLLSGRGV